jgi:hypothetical protein
MSTRARSLQALRELVDRLEWDYAAPAKQANFSIDLEAGKICKPRHRDRGNRDLSSCECRTPLLAGNRSRASWHWVGCVRPIERARNRAEGRRCPERGRRRRKKEKWLAEKRAVKV